MADLPEWLPGLVLLQSYGGSWQQYVEAIYSFFCQDFIESTAHYRNQRVIIKRLPMTDGKETTFWHLVSEGSVEAERTPDLRRCERIRWPRPVIEHSEEPVLKVWENERRGERRVCLWLAACRRDAIVAG